VEKHEFLQLVNKYLAGTASSEEEQQVMQFLESFPAAQDWDEQLMGIKEQVEEKMLQRLLKTMDTLPQQRPKVRAIRAWMAVAATVAVLVISSMIYFNLPNAHVQQSPAQTAQQTTPVLQPGGNKALLKLANGQTIVLNQAANGVLAMQGSTQIKKAADGELVYEPGDAAKQAGTTFNTLTTPPGGQFQITLPDGTKVWLNAASSITFPTVFSGQERRVQLSGEAYFEVAKVSRNNSRMPFFVSTSGGEVAVLGTHFNVMAYPDAPNQETTLLEGAVQVTHGAQTQKITPGQQASVLNKTGAAILVKQANIEAVMAWKEGLFLFDNTNIESAMNDIKRWYNATIIYNGPQPDVAFTGVLPRSTDVNTVLNMLASTRRVSFTVKGDIITVQKAKQSN
jgi:ferric-dicitrate binding protein FerR (iron transport regulator)